MRRISLDQFLAGDAGPWSEPVWIDQVLYDIPNTVEGAIRSAAAAGAKAVTLYAGLLKMRSYDGAVAAAKECGLAIYAAGDDYERRLWWPPRKEEA